MFIFGSCVLIAALLSATAGRADTNHARGLSHTTWKPMCAMTTNLAAASTEAQTNLEEALKAQENNHKLLLQLKIYTAKQAPGERLKLMPVVAALIGTKQRSMAVNHKEAAKAVEAVQATAYVRGRLSEFLSIAANAHTSAGAHGCIAKDATGSAIEGEAQLTGCTLETTPAKKSSPTNFDTTAAKLFSANGANPEAAKRDTTATCGLLSTAANGITGSNAMAKTLDLAAGYLKLTANDGGAFTHANIGSFDYSTRGSWPTAFHETAKTQADYKSSELSKPYDQINPEQTTASSGPAFMSALKEYVVGDNNKYNPTVDDPKLAKDTEPYNGADKPYTLQAIYKKMQETDIDRKIFDPAATDKSKLTDISNLWHLQIVLLHFEAQIARDQKRAAAKECSAAIAPKDAEELCNGKSGDAKACNETAGCIYNSTGETNKKCTLKKEVKAQLEKENQETGGKDGKTPSDRRTKHTKKDDCKDQNLNGKANAKTPVFLPIIN